jgi:hypothetical protein
VRLPEDTPGTAGRAWQHWADPAAAVACWGEAARWLAPDVRAMCREALRHPASAEALALAREVIRAGWYWLGQAYRALDLSPHACGIYREELEALDWYSPTGRGELRRGRWVDAAVDALYEPAAWIVVHRRCELRADGSVDDTGLGQTVAGVQAVDDAAGSVLAGSIGGEWDAGWGYSVCETRLAGACEYWALDWWPSLAEVSDLAARIVSRCRGLGPENVLNLARLTVLRENLGDALEVGYLPGEVAELAGHLDAAISEAKWNSREARLFEVIGGLGAALTPLTGPLGVVMMLGGALGSILLEAFGRAVAYNTDTFGRRRPGLLVPRISGEPGPDDAPVHDVALPPGYCGAATGPAGAVRGVVTGEELESMADDTGPARPPGETAGEAAGEYPSGAGRLVVWLDGLPSTVRVTLDGEVWPRPGDAGAWVVRRARDPGQGGRFGGAGRRPFGSTSRWGLSSFARVGSHRLRVELARGEVERDVEITTGARAVVALTLADLGLGPRDGASPPGDLSDDVRPGRPADGDGASPPHVDDPTGMRPGPDAGPPAGPPASGPPARREPEASSGSGWGKWVLGGLVVGLVGVGVAVAVSQRREVGV